MKRQTACHLTTLFFLLIAWELLTHHIPCISFIFPKPSKIFLCGIHSYKQLLSQSVYTIQGILGGFCLACCLSMFLAILMLVLPSIKKWLHPIFVFIQCTPMFALAPLIVLWVGWNVQAVILPTALTIFFPLTLTIYQGIKAIPPEFKEQFILLQASPWQMLLKLRLPHALPYILSGLKIAITSAGFATIAGEWVASQKGLGVLILESRRNYQMELTFAGLFTLSLLTFILFQVILLIEKRAFEYVRITSKQRKKTTKLQWILAFIPLTSFFFWHSYFEKKPAPIAGLTELHLLLDWTPNANHIPLFVGIEKQFFQDEGIQLYIRKNLETGSGIPHLLLEQIDLTLYHCLGTVKAVLNGAPLQIVGRLIDSSLQGFIYRDDGYIHKLEDLNGKTLGFCLNQTSDITYLLQTLHLHHVIPKEIKNVSSDMISPMLLKKIDFLYGAFYNIQGEKLKSLGVPIGVFLSDTYRLNTGPQLLLCGKKGTKATQSHTVQAIRKALQRSIDFCKNHPEEAFSIYCQITHQSQDITLNEHAQWLATIPLLAHDQTELPSELINHLLMNIIDRYPELTRNCSSFQEQMLYPKL